MPLNEDFLKRFRLKHLPRREREAIESAARSAARKGEKLNPSKPETLIQNYLQRFRDLLNERPTPERRLRALEVLKEHLHQALIKDVPESYFASLQRRHREEGHGDIEIPPDLKAELTQTLLDDQRHSLDTWIDYLASDDAKYPDPLKYLAFRSVLKMGRFDKETHQFTDRTGKNSVSPFPELNREALAVIFEDMEKKYAGKTDSTFTARYDIGAGEKDAYRQALDKEDFPTLYALAIDAFKPIAEDLLTMTEGKWRTYPKGSDPTPLVDSIANYGTGWCIRGESTARRYLENNMLQIYYSNDPQGNPTVPRVVMVVNAANQITEVRGIEAHEHLDSHIGPVVEQTLNEHPDGAKYKKKSSDMQRLTDIDRHIKAKTFDSLPKEEKRQMLQFLYEVDSRIEGFGYEAAGRDPRIEEIRSTRNLKEDLPILFNCTPNQIALAPSEISSRTRAYIGTLEPGIFSLLEKYSIDHIYTSFPEGKIQKESLKIGTLTAKELEAKLDEKDPQGNGKFWLSSYARSMLHNKGQFIDPVDKRHRERQGKPESITLVRLRVRDLGYHDPKNLPTTRELFGNPGKRNGRIHHYGLELCPPETAAQYRLSHLDQPMGDWFYVGMEPVTGSAGSPYVFDVNRDEDGLCLYGIWTEPDCQWRLDDSLVLRLGKSETQKP